MPIRITSPDDDRVADYFRLTDVALRKKLETERGLYMAESEKVIRRADELGLAMVFTGERHFLH